MEDDVPTDHGGRPALQQEDLSQSDLKLALGQRRIPHTDHARPFHALTQICPVLRGPSACL